jgi:hypothetical protein
MKPASSSPSRPFRQPPVEHSVFLTQALHLAFQYPYPFLQARELCVLGRAALSWTCRFGSLFPTRWRQIAQLPNFGG